MLVGQDAHLSEATFLATIKISAIRWYSNLATRLVSLVTLPNQ